MTALNLTPPSTHWEANLTDAIKSAQLGTRYYQGLTTQRLCEAYLGEYLPAHRAALRAEILARDIVTRGDALAALRVLEVEDDRALARHLLDALRFGLLRRSAPRSALGAARGERTYVP
jgi:hypothetical protein